MNKRGRGRRAGAEGDVAEEVEDPREAKLFGNPEKHQLFPPASASTRAASPIELDPLTSTASPGPIASRASGWPPPRRAHAPISTLPAKRFRERLHLLADQDRIIDLRRRERLGERGVEVVAVRRRARASRRARRSGGRRPSPRRAPSGSPPSRPDWRCSFRRSAAPRRRRPRSRCRSPRPLRPPRSASARPAARGRRRPPRPPPAPPARWPPNARPAGDGEAQLRRRAGCAVDHRAALRRRARRRRRGRRRPRRGRR